MESGKSWFADPQQHGTRWEIEVERSLHRRRTAFQTIEVLESPVFGRVLALDGIVQTTEKDEAFYHEMLVHPAMLAHPRPKRVVVLGGGDGGALRRVLEHDVDEAVLVEIDREVIEVSKEHMPSLSRGAFEDPRVKIEISDGRRYIEGTSQAFDVVIVDAPDPIGPGTALFTKQLFELIDRRLSDGGVTVVQSESALMMPTQLAQIHLTLQAVFPFAATYLGHVPAYGSGSFSYTMGVKGPAPSTDLLAARMEERGLQTVYLSDAILRALFALPAYLERFLKASVERGAPADEHPLFPFTQGAGLR